MAVELKVALKQLNAGQPVIEVAILGGGPTREFRNADEL